MSALQHDVPEPDVLCEGDDPCICEQLRSARIQTLEHVLFVIDKGGRAAAQVERLLARTRGDS